MGAVHGAPSQIPVSLRTGKITGNFPVFQPFRPFPAPVHVNFSVSDQVVTRNSLFGGKTGNVAAGTGNSRILLLYKIVDGA
jgi:hypothetical protein